VQSAKYMVVLGDCSASDEDDGYSTSTEEFDWRPGMSAYCTFVLGGVVRAAQVMVVEPGVLQSIVAAPYDCGIAASGGWLDADGACELDDQQSFACSCVGTGERCRVVFHSIGSEAVIATPMLGCCEFRTSKGKLGRPTARSVMTAYYGQAEEKAYRIQTNCGDAQDKPFDAVRTAPESVAFSSNSVILIPDLLTKAECQMLIDVAEQHIAASSIDAQPLQRLPVRELGSATDEFATHVIRDRVIPFFEQELPHVAQGLFGRATGLNGMRLSYSCNEPAVNRYTAGGEFLIHHDAFSVTVNVLLSEPRSFVGGGTAFWPQHQPEASGARAPVLLRPRRGTAAIFNGEVEHAGRPVESGLRHLFVASFHLS